jgi:hypothetical protein
MALYGILRNSTNNGADEDLQNVFSAPLSINSNQTTYASDTVNLRRRSYRSTSQRWEIEASISRCDSSVNYLVHSVVNGNTDIINVRMPQPPELSNYKNDVCIVNGDTLAGSTIIPIRSFIDIPIGIFINLPDQTKVYLVRESNSYEIKIFPALLKSISNGDLITFGPKVTMKAYYDTGTRIGINYGDGILSDISGVKLIEAL